MHSTYLYVHESNQVYMMVQFDHEEHPFSVFRDRRFHFIGYMAAHGKVSPLYCDELSEVEKPWLQKLRVVGVLGIPDNAGAIHEHPLFEETVGDSDFLVKTSLGQQLSVVTDDPPSMLELSLFAHPTVTGDTPSMFEPPHPAPFNNAINPSPLDSLLLTTPNSPSIHSTSAAHMFDFTLWPLSSTVVSDSVTAFEASEELYGVAGNPTPTDAHVQLHPDLQWRESIDLWGKYEPTQRTNIERSLKKSRSWLRLLTLTKALLSGSLWVGLYGNPFKITAVEYRRAITSNFLTALRIEGKTYDEVRDQPLILKEGRTEIAIGWQILRTHLLGWFDHSKSELRKVIKGATMPLTKFCDASESGREEEITRLVKLLNSERCLDVQAAISKLVDGQAFAELLWTSVVDANRRVFGGRYHMSLDNTTQFYQTMLLALKEHLGKERKEELAVYLDHKVISDVLIAALGPMYQQPHLFPQFTHAVMRLPFIQYENVLHFDPKMKLPRMIGKTNISRTMDDVNPIDIKAVEVTSSSTNTELQLSAFMDSAPELATQLVSVRLTVSPLAIEAHPGRSVVECIACFPDANDIRRSQDKIWRQHYVRTWSNENNKLR
ncbi:hypothetical protein DFH29DRAFT_874419 [Suillus ampliporus]|nr:hypothetical protein DFH29DRAFT_874419 [Suillus ampliporus]